MRRAAVRTLEETVSAQSMPATRRAVEEEGEEDAMAWGHHRKCLGVDGDVLLHLQTLVRCCVSIYLSPRACGNHRLPSAPGQALV